MTRKRIMAFGGVLVVLAAAVAAVASTATAKPSATAPKLNKPGTLTVGMTLQFKPQMYLNAAGKPAGYDVVLLKALAKQMGVKLDIKNLDFNGLIPGLVAKKFDMGMLMLGNRSTGIRTNAAPPKTAIISATTMMKYG